MAVEQEASDLSRHLRRTALISSDDGKGLNATG